MKITNKKSLALRAITVVLFLFSCFYMYDFYKALSGFIANGFREPLVMLPMILAFFLPVFCFLFFIYDVYVRAVHPVIKTVYSLLVALYAVADLVFIFKNISLYASNHAYGVYDALPSVIVAFPYDMIVILTALFAFKIFDLAVVNRKSTRVRSFLDSVKQRGTLCLSLWEYLLLSVLAIVVFVFTGSAVYATFSAFSNAFYDARYLFLLLWVMLVPLANLLFLTLKPEKACASKRGKIVWISSLIALNILFGALFVIFEITRPDFLVYIGKPLFLIAFSVSLPIEPAILLGIMAFGTLVAMIRLALVLLRERAK